MGSDSTPETKQEQPPPAKQTLRKDDEPKHSKEVNRKLLMLEHFTPKTSIKLAPELTDTTADLAIQMSPESKLAGRYGHPNDYVVLPKIDNPTRGHRKTYSELKGRND